jgi:dolichol-phosphate mannosyltransferase
VVEQLIRNQQVTGSNPVAGSDIFTSTMPGLPNPLTLSVVVPTLNEVENVEPLIAQVLAHAPGSVEIVIVDDGSTDGTRECIRGMMAAHPVRLVTRDDPVLGLAGAVMEGARAARGDLVVVMDADLSHPPCDIPALTAPIFSGRADMVIGSRYVRGGSTPGWPIYRKAMSRIASGLAYPLTGVHDSMCGFFAIRRARLLELAPAASGFKIAFEAIVRGGRDLRVLEIPIAFRDRACGTSKMRFGVALIFSLRWLAAAAHIASRRSGAGEARPRFAAAEAQSK